MEITVEAAEGEQQVTILSLEGRLDGSNYRDLIDKATEICEGRAHNLVIDMSQVPFMSSAGIVALHSIARLAQGQEAVDTSKGWNAYRTVGATKGQTQGHVKLLGVQEMVQEVLDVTGTSNFFETYADRDAALASF